MGNVMACLPASGGVGSTTLAAAVAVRAAAAGLGVVALDLDRAAGALDVVLGVEQDPGWRWADLEGVSGVVDGAALARRLPTSCGVAVLSGARADGWRPPAEDPWLDIVPDVVAGLSESHDLVVVDLARDVAVLAAIGLLVDVAVVVLGSGVSELAAGAAVVPGVRRVLATAREAGRPWEEQPLLPIEPWVVIRGQRVEPDLEDLVTDELDVPVVAVVGDDRRLRDELARGLPPGVRGRGAVVRAADELLLRLTAQRAAA
ncbi:hypothetical protein [Terrabacter sp. NPDC000476]|uniref:nucleotide-binding protein n=1 Tax=Terrabacter sp. NPDC000476 TaxID=3154258 RepID=UPI0033239461